jgi:hypothetical protein
VGLTAGYKLALPLFGPATLVSELDVRFLIPDDDDRSIDLALALTNSNKLVVALGRQFSLFAMADLYFVKGKLEVNDEVGGSWILGGGLQFSRAFRL